MSFREGPAWAYYLGESILAVPVLIIGIPLLVVAFFYPQRMTELRRRKDKNSPMSNAERIKWIFIGLFMALGGLYSLITNLSYMILGCPYSTCRF